MSGHRFDCLLVTSLPEGSGMTKHRTSDTGHMKSTVYWSHLYYLPRRATQRLNSGTEWTKGLWWGRLCSNKRVRCALVLRGGCDWLVSMTVWAGGEVKPIRMKTRWSAAVPAVEKLSRWGASPIWGEEGTSSKSWGTQQAFGALWSSRCQGSPWNLRPYKPVIHTNYIGLRGAQVPWLFLSLPHLLSHVKSHFWWDR